MPDMPKAEPTRPPESATFDSPEYQAWFNSPSGRAWQTQQDAARIAALWELPTAPAS